ncbi:hypothetical protein NQD34_002383 [Periophthalmus magnuspinnatus]|nr:hypothetical protein NQD34_002383 [Periophthalmus magnuspinnatus]
MFDLSNHFSVHCLGKRQKCEFRHSFYPDRFCSYTPQPKYGRGKSGQQHYWLFFFLYILYCNMEDQEMQLKVRRVTDKFTESMYVLANEPSVALYRLQEHVRRSLPELVQHKTDMQSWEEQSQGAIYTVEYACSAVKSMTNSSLYFKNIDGLLR